MEKRVLPLIIIALLTLTFPLFGSLFRSNSLAQKLEEIDQNDRDRYEWVLEQEQNSFTLYNKGFVSVVGHEVKERGNRSVTYTFYDKEGQLTEEREYIYQEGLLVKSSHLYDLHIRLNFYRYEENSLVEITTLTDGLLSLLTTFFRSQDGSLMGVRLISTDQDAKFDLHTSINQIPTFSESEGPYTSTYQFVAPNLTVEQRWIKDTPLVTSEVSFNEEGEIVITQGDRDDLLTSKYYDSEGLLVRQEKIKEAQIISSISYYYDLVGKIDHSVEISGEEQEIRVERWYVNENLQDLTEWVHEIPTQAIRYADDGTSRLTLFEQGRPYADVTYAPDGKRVLSIEYRKER